VGEKVKSNLALLEQYRIKLGPWASSKGDENGCFLIPGPHNIPLLIMSSGNLDKDWEHVSISGKNRCPNWPEMCHVKDLFWSPDELVIQFHPPRSTYVDNHPFCLHLWKPLKQIIAPPPPIMVGIPGVKKAKKS
jgi:hypothetical protein